MLKSVGKLIAVGGSAVAILFPPYMFIGTRKWGFIFSDVFSAFGARVTVAESIDWLTLALELIAINGIAMALIFAARKK